MKLFLEPAYELVQRFHGGYGRVQLVVDGAGEGCIQITRLPWELLRDDFVAEPLGLVDVKGKVWSRPGAS